MASACYGGLKWERAALDHILLINSFSHQLLPQGPLPFSGVSQPLTRTLCIQELDQQTQTPGPWGGAPSKLRGFPMCLGEHFPISFPHFSPILSFPRPASFCGVVIHVILSHPLAAQSHLDPLFSAL